MAVRENQDMFVIAIPLYGRTVEGALNYDNTKHHSFEEEWQFERMSNFYLGCVERYSFYNVFSQEGIAQKMEEYFKKFLPEICNDTNFGILFSEKCLWCISANEKMHFIAKNIILSPNNMIRPDMIFEFLNYVYDFHDFENHTQKK